MTNTAQTKTMLWWGRFDPDYSRNRVLRSLLRQAGWHLDDFMPLVSSLAGIEALVKKIARPDAVWVPAFRQRDFSSARSFADRHGIPLIFDPLISAYDKVVFERKKFCESDKSARKILKAEQELFSRADLVIADTEPHARFFVDVLAAPATKTHVIPVGAEEGLFSCQPSGPPGDPPEIFFYGSFISLQGTETIINAAIQIPEARWTLLGTGPLRRVCEEQSQGHGHIHFEAPIPYEKLPERIGAADILLGIFGSSPKAGRVIPNKVYQSLACGRPLITRQSPAYPKLLEQDPACGITFIPPANPAALANAVRNLLADPALLASSGRQARNSYETWFSASHIQEALTRALAKLREKGAGGSLERKTCFRRGTLTMNTSRIQLSYVVPVYFNQRDAHTLIDLLRRYSTYAKDLTAGIQFVIVDDGSPLPIVIPEDINLNISLYRITTDIRWNQCGARNLGVVHAKSPRIILSDSDHYFPERLLQGIINSRVPKRTVYKFKRVDGHGLAIGKAMNIFYTSKAIFFQTLGYDEEFSGNYGYEDLYFLDFQRRVGNAIRYFTRFQKIIATEVDRELSYHSLERDTAVNLALYENKKVLLRQKDPYISHSRNFLQFDWILAEERRV